jgi:Family of unknown function (DUF6504)
MNDLVRPIRFIDQPITVQFNEPPALEKKPGCPAAFTWAGTPYVVTELLAEWVNYQRRGRMARNMQPQHAAVASNRGSWGVGRFHFRVRVESGQIFQIYYDRAPKDVDERKGSWVLVGEFEAQAP